MIVDGGILAGGEGSRMGGADKGLLDWQGMPMIARLTLVLQPQVDRLWISANRNVSAYQTYGTVLTDQISGCGPLAGLAVLRAASTAEWLLTLPCDGWPVPYDLAERMLRTTAAAGFRLGVAAQGPHTEWCVLLVHQSLQQDIAAALAGGQRSMQGWCRRHDFARVEYAAAEGWFRNMNTPQDWGME